MKKTVLFFLFPFLMQAQLNENLKRGDFYYKASKKDSAVYFYKKGIDLCFTCKDTTLVSYYLKYAEMQKLVGKEDISLQYILKSEKIYEKYGDFNGLAKAKISKAELLRFMERFEEATTVIDKVGKLLKKHKLNKEIQARFYNRKAAILNQRGIDPKQIIALSEKCLEIAKEIKDYDLQVYSYNEMATLLEKINPKKADAYYIKGLSIAKKQSYDFATCDILINLSYFERKKVTSKYTKDKLNKQLLKTSILYFKEGLALATKINYLDLQVRFSRGLFYNYMDVGDKEKAYAYFLKSHDYELERIKQDRTKKIKEIETKYNLEKKEKELKLNQQKIRYQSFGLLILLVLLSFLSFLFNKSKKDKIKIAQVLNQKTVLLKEIHHRVKNNLQVISGLLYLQANKYDNECIHKMVNDSQKHIDSIALVHEMLYQDDELSLISMQKYFEKLGVRILQIYYLKEVKYTVETHQIKLSIDQATTLGLILNELITNSLKHAFKEKKGFILVKLLKEGNQIKFCYTDDGIGMDIKKQKESSLGVKLIKMFAEEMDAEMHVENKNGVYYTLTFKSNIKCLIC